MSVSVPKHANVLSTLPLTVQQQQLLHAIDSSENRPILRELLPLLGGLASGDSIQTLRYALNQQNPTYPADTTALCSAARAAAAYTDEGIKEGTVIYRACAIKFFNHMKLSINSLSSIKLRRAQLRRQERRTRFGSENHRDELIAVERDHATMVSRTPLGTNRRTRSAVLLEQAHENAQLHGGAIETEMEFIRTLFEVGQYFSKLNDLLMPCLSCIWPVDKTAGNRVKRLTALLEQNATAVRVCRDALAILVPGMWSHLGTSILAKVEFFNGGTTCLALQRMTRLDIERCLKDPVLFAAMLEETNVPSMQAIGSPSSLGAICVYGLAGACEGDIGSSANPWLLGSARLVDDNSADTMSVGEAVSPWTRASSQVRCLGR